MNVSILVCLLSYIRWLSTNCDPGPTVCVLQYMEALDMPLQHLYDVLTLMERYDAAREVHDVIRERMTSHRGQRQPQESPEEEDAGMTYHHGEMAPRREGEDNFMMTSLSTSANSMTSHFCDVMHGHTLASLPSLPTHETLTKTRISDESVPVPSPNKPQRQAKESAVTSRFHDVRGLPMTSHFGEARSTSFPSGKRGEGEEHSFPMCDDDDH